MKYPKPKWEFRAISCMIRSYKRNKEIVYGKENDKGKLFECLQIFWGENFIVNARGRSYHMTYKMNEIPKKYKEIAKKLIGIHRKTKWSRKKIVDTEKEEK